MQAVHNIIQFFKGLHSSRENDLLKNQPRIAEQYYQIFNKKLDLQKIDSFNAYIQSTKLDKKNEKLWPLIDKYAVRAHIAKVIGEKYLTKLLGVWDKTDQINYSQLPSQFVLKTNHGSAWNIIVKDSSQLNQETTHQYLNEWLSKNFFDVTLEPHYRRIQPKILAEEYLADDNGELIDYKFFCFHGQPCFIQVDMGRFTENHTRINYDLNWQPLPFTIPFTIYIPPTSDSKLAKPANLAEMINIAARLSKGHTHVRVDLYNVNGRIVFGELTFTHGSGFKKFHPDDTYNLLLGDIIRKAKKPREIFNLCY